MSLRLQELNIEANTSLWEFRKDIPRVLKSLDCFIFPSLTEGQPNALIEAMISGVPFIASDIPPIKECVPEKYHYLLFSVDDVNGYVNQITVNDLSGSVAQDLMNWSRIRFDSIKNFTLFKQILF